MVRLGFGSSDTPPFYVRARSVRLNEVYPLIILEAANKTPPSKKRRQMTKPLGPKPVVGRFKVEEGRWVHGELKIDGEASHVYLRDEEFFWLDAEDKRVIAGELHDFSKVTLVKCNSPGTGSFSRGERGYSFADVFPHYVIHGDAYLDPDAPEVEEVTFQISDDAPLFYDFDAFGSLIRTKHLIDPLIKAYEDIVKRPVEVGERPEIAFFTGRRLIFEADTVLGKVSAENRAYADGGGPRGVHIDNSIVVRVVYSKPARLEDVTVDIIRLLRFFEIIVGRPQSLVRSSLLRAGRSEREGSLDLHWSLAPQRTPAFRRQEDREPQTFDMLMTPAREPSAFANVLSAWLARDDEWMDPRIRFSGCFGEQNRFDVDRLVAAANMFDILPKTATGTEATLSAAMSKVRDEAHSAFLGLAEESPEKESILIALSRLGSVRLKNKVRARAKIVLDAVGSLPFPELELVCDQAVNCRNYFVHGGNRKFDYSNNFTAVMFMTLVLEMVFALSDLIECGWDVNSWLGRGTTKSHPFGALLVDYKGQLADLKKLLPSKA